MRAVVTRVTSASVEIDGAVHGKIGKGFLVLLGVHQDDTEAEALKIADKICGLRVFDDADGKMNLAPADAGAAELLIVSSSRSLPTASPAVPASQRPRGLIRRSRFMSLSSASAASAASR